MIFDINGLMIEADGVELLENIRSQLSRQGITLMHTIKLGNNNVQFSCVSHKGGQERKPSCGMSLSPAYSNGRLIPAGTVHCFTCGYTATLPEFISECFGKVDGGKFGNKWLKKNYVTTQVINRPKLNLQFNRTPVEKKSSLIVPESILDEYRYYHDYMYERKLTDEIIEIFDVGYDKKTDCLTFPVKSVDGTVAFVQTRSVKTKFHHYAEGIVKTNYVYGAYEVMKHYPDAKEVVICESILNALTLWVHGIPAVALMGVGGGEQYNILKALPYRQYVLGLDPDEAGEKASKRLIKMLKHNKILFRYIYEDDRDLNDLGELVLDLKKELV